MPEKPLNTQQVADELGLHAKTVLRYFRTGVIPARRTNGDSGPWRCTRKALDQYLNHHYNPRTGH